jgi:hypothetical protein
VVQAFGIFAEKRLVCQVSQTQPDRHLELGVARVRRSVDGSRDETNQCHKRSGLNQFVTDMIDD